jgi:hypothetical protein
VNRNRNHRLGVIAALLVAVAVVAVVAWQATTNDAPSSPPAAAASTPTLQPISHVVLIMEENKAYSATHGHMPYLDSVAAKYGLATNYWATNYPSEPNYMMLTSGYPVPGKDCSPSSGCTSSHDNIFHQLGSNWRVLAESMPSACAKSNSGKYVPRHTAAPYYTDLAATCKAQDVAYSSSATPNIGAAFTLIAPNLCDDMHDCAVSAGDNWLKTVVPKILNSAQFATGNTLLEVTWDSGSHNCGASCPSQVELVLANPRLAGKTSATKATHCSLLSMNERLLGLATLGCAVESSDLRAAFGL